MLKIKKLTMIKFSKFYKTTTTKNPIEITQGCVDRINYLNLKKNQKRNLRILVESGGCSGFQSKFQFSDDLNDDDM